MVHGCATNQRACDRAHVANISKHDFNLIRREMFGNCFGPFQNTNCFAAVDQLADEVTANETSASRNERPNGTHGMSLTALPVKSVKTSRTCWIPVFKRNCELRP